ncbi:MAG: CDP-alcohol phosphatidyltransferase family protein [Armatimonadetes bacterium]|nr:CDP-alcohol phosphatidyltransferase family protein [Akkermansiaceae bacterium]
MTFATKITITRMILVPVFAVFSISYGHSVREDSPMELYRWWALATFVTAAASDGIDGWVARRFNQRSELGAYLDPIADKALVFTAIVILSIYEWGGDGWRLPLWFASLVIARDSMILAGIRFIHSTKHPVEIHPHWTGKVCTFSIFAVLGWMMFGPLPLSPSYPCALAAVFIIWSMITYIKQGLDILKRPKARD